MVLNERVEACKRWFSRLSRLGLECGLLIGGMENREEVERTIHGLQAGTINVGIGTTIADEGLDIPRLTHVVLTCPVHSHPKRLEQMLGRAARPFEGKTEGVGIYFWDSQMFPFIGRFVSNRQRKEKLEEFLKKLSKSVDVLEVAS